MLRTQIGVGKARMHTIVCQVILLFSSTVSIQVFAVTHAMDACMHALLILLAHAQALPQSVRPEKDKEGGGGNSQHLSRCNEKDGVALFFSRRKERTHTYTTAHTNTPLTDREINT